MSGVMIDRPNGIRVYQLLAVKSAIKLEIKGLKHSSGSVKASWARHYGLSPRAKPEAVLAKIEEELKSLEEKGDLGINTF